MQAALPSPRAKTPAAGASSTGSKALSFNPSELSFSSFTPQSFIASVRVHAPLRVVRDDLRSHLSALQAELVGCVQRDFHTFASFGPAISDADALSAAAAVPLSALRRDLVSLLSSLNDQIAALNQTLVARREAAARTSALRTLIDANDLLHKCERLLREYAPMANKSSQEGLRLVERIAGEAAQLSFTLSRAVDGAFVNAISVRISAIRRGVRTCLEAWLRRALFPTDGDNVDSVYDNEILSRVLAMYVVSGMTAEAEDFFRRDIVAPFTRTRLRMTPMLAVAERNVKNGTFKARREAQTKEQTSRDGTQPSTIAVTAADALQAAEGEVVNFLGEKVMPIVSLCEAEERLRTKLDFVGRAVWPQIERAISSHMSAAFSPGIPDVFHQSVLAGSRLYAAIEAAVGDDTHRDALRKSTATLDFWKHWNLPVYFQLRFQEVTSKFDQHLSEGPVSLASSPLGANDLANSGSRLLRTDMYRAVPTASLVASLRRCWSEDVFLSSLTHRFLRLSLQLLARYSTWVRTGLAGEWTNQDAVPKGAARVFYDITVLQKRIPAELSSVLRLRSSSFSSDLLDNLDTAFSDACEGYSSLLPELSRSISDSLAKSCIENLQPLRGILATYRMSTKQAPSTHSTFVPKILRPLKIFLKEHEDAIESDERIKVATAVCEQTTAEYFNMATDLLQRNKSSEATLRRLNIGRSGAHAGSAMSVIDKISMQLYLDVAKFMDDIKGLGVSSDDIPSLGRLWDSVKREDTSDPIEKEPVGSTPSGQSAASPRTNREKDTTVAPEVDAPEANSSEFDANALSPKNEASEQKTSSETDVTT